MVLPFVRDLFADVRKLPGFARVTSHLRGGTGRIRVSGLRAPAKALLLAELQRVLGQPLVVLVVNNQAAEDLLPVLQAFSQLVGGAPADSIVLLPAHDVVA